MPLACCTSSESTVAKWPRNWTEKWTGSYEVFDSTTESALTPLLLPNTSVEWALEKAYQLPSSIGRPWTQCPGGPLCCFFWLSPSSSTVPSLSRPVHYFLCPVSWYQFSLCHYICVCLGSRCCDDPHLGGFQRVLRWLLSPPNWIPHLPRSLLQPPSPTIMREIFPRVRLPEFSPWGLPAPEPIAE